MEYIRVESAIDMDTTDEIEVNSDEETVGVVEMKDKGKWYGDAADYWKVRRVCIWVWHSCSGPELSLIGSLCTRGAEVVEARGNL